MSIVGSEVRKQIALSSFLERNLQFHESIRYFEEMIFDKIMKEGIDLNYSDEHFTLPIVAAISYNNVYAFNQIMSTLDGKWPNCRKFDPNKLTANKTVPLYSAVWHGHEEFVQALLAKGADAKAFCGESLLSVAFEAYSNNAIISNAQAWFLGNRDGGNPIKEEYFNFDLKKEMEDFYYQRGTYHTFNKRKPVPFNLNDRTINVLYKGKLDIINLLLSAGASPNIAPTGTNRTPLITLEQPEEFRHAFHATPGEGHGFLVFNDDGDRDEPMFELMFWNRPRNAYVPIRVYYNLIAVRQIFTVFAHKSASEKSIVEAISKKIDEENAQNFQEVEARFRQVEANIQFTQLQVNTMYSDLAARTDYLAGWLTVLSSETKALVQASQLEQAWKSRKDRIDCNELAKIFCTALDLGLRKAIKQSEVGSPRCDVSIGEKVLIGALDFLGDSASFIPFAKLVFGIPSKIITAFGDRNHEQDQRKLSALFAFKDSEEICDRTAISVTEECLVLLNGNVIKNQSEAEALAKKTIALLLFAVQEDLIVNSQPIDEQLVHYLKRSELYTKHLNALQKLAIKESPTLTYSLSAMSLSSSSKAAESSAIQGLSIKDATKKQCVMM